LSPSFTAEWSMAKIALSNLTVYLMLRKQGVKQKLR
jgi:hypothetical protein